MGTPHARARPQGAFCYDNSENGRKGQSAVHTELTLKMWLFKKRSDAGSGSAVLMEKVCQA